MYTLADLQLTSQSSPMVWASIVWQQLFHPHLSLQSTPSTHRCTSTDTKKVRKADRERRMARQIDRAE